MNGNSCPRNSNMGRTSVVMILFAIISLGFAQSSTAQEKPLRITSDGFFKQRPCWSKDQHYLVFARHRGNTIYLFLHDMKTGQEERLTQSMHPEFDAVFSPDGKELLFAFDKVSPGQGDIDVHRLLFSDRKSILLAGTEQGLSHEEFPCWAPDGKRFAFTSTRHGNQELYVGSTAGGEWQRLTDDAAIDAHPAWSPDGKTIAFSTSRWGDLEIALISPDGSNLRRLTESRGMDDYPAWSPDGRSLAYMSKRDGNCEIYIQPLEGPAKNVTNNPAIDNFPTFTSDGRLGFISNRDGGFDVYLMKLPD